MSGLPVAHDDEHCIRLSAARITQSCPCADIPCTVSCIVRLPNWQTVNRRLASACSIAVVLLCLGVSSATVAQSPSPQVTQSEASAREYDELIHEALSEFSVGNFAEARALFERAHGVRPSARTLRGLGVTAFELKRYVDSHHELAAALRDTRTPLTGEQRLEVEGLLRNVRRFIGTVTFELTPKDARVYVDDRKVERGELLLDVGVHTVSVRAPGYREALLELVVDGAQDRIERVDLVALELSPRRAALASARANRGEVRQSAAADESGSTFSSPWFWVGAAAVVTSGTTLAIVLALSHGRSDPAEPYRGTAATLRGP